MAVTSHVMAVGLKGECARMDRCCNVARVVNSHKKEWDGKGLIPMDQLRLVIRRQLGLPVLHGEERHGDMRAHGDACGGHGLKLPIVRNSRGRFIKNIPETYKICEDWVKDHDGGGQGVLQLI